MFRPEERHNPPHPPVFTTTDERISHWTNAKDAWVKGYWYYDWSDQSMRVDKVDPEKASITPKKIRRGTARKPDRDFSYSTCWRSWTCLENGITTKKYRGSVRLSDKCRSRKRAAFELFIEQYNRDRRCGVYNTEKNLNIAGTRNSGIVLHELQKCGHSIL